ncbi:LPS export ABC transporter permease LptG [Phenylobacterium sp.]|jgi:lipopolysaccharide export system permease protein|uniref:LPS export ABC transporter permease LptG n=1 Tax=Phenylobacterium sp. TaxID=1871053 RepID=UPI002E2FA437|nr:LPS export ABC transporter permease LptG [Phenylobacterium sp.]HEX3366958.1 LPS export ABC transporter permease LptG [Phenylobacterium sp.]
MNSRLERYVLARNLAGVGVALVMISSLILLVQFVDLSRTIGVRTDVSAADIFGLTLLKSPSVIQILLPFVFLFGGISAYVGLNRRSELVAMRAAGVSAWRFIMPSATAAFFIGVIAVLAINPVSAALSARFEADRAKIMANYLGSDVPKDVWLRQGDERTQMVIHAKARDTVQGEVRLRDVSLFVYQKNRFGQPEFKRRLEAAEAVLRPGFWQLKDVREATAGESSVQSDSLSIRSTLDSEAAVERFASPDAIAFWRLPGAIKQTEDSGFSASGYRLRFQQLLSTPLMFAAMAVLAAAFSLRLVRLGGLAGLAGAGVALGFVVFFFNQLSGALGRADIIPLFAAAWAPAAVALLSGLTLLCYTEDG